MVAAELRLEQVVAALQAEAARLKAAKSATAIIRAKRWLYVEKPSKDMPAGRLLDELGCKGWSVGAAEYLINVQFYCEYQWCTSHRCG